LLDAAKVPLSEIVYQPYPHSLYVCAWDRLIAPLWYVVPEWVWLNFV
jgi:hypothetical protein